MPGWVRASGSQCHIKRYLPVKCPVITWLAAAPALDGICVQPSMHPRGRCTANGSRISAGQPKKAMRTDSANFPVVSRAKLLRLRRPPLSPAAGTCDCSSARHSRFELRSDSTGPGIPIHPRGAPQNGEDAWGNGVSVAGTRRCNGPGGAAVLGLILHRPIPGLIPAGPN